MINPGQFVLELILIVAALAVSRVLPTTRHWRFVLGVAALAACANFLFYDVAVRHLYLAKGIDRSVMVANVAFETVRWGVLAYVLSRLGVRLQENNRAPGFLILRAPERIWRAPAVGVVAGCVAAGAMYALSVVQHHLGFADTLPWPVANGEPLDLRLTIGAGLRNLVGEEIFARLGAQSLVLYFARRTRGGALLAILVSSLYFEIWHNPFEVPQFLNFTGSCVFGWVYHRYGYESAAVAHCVADWLVLGLLPMLLFA